MHRALFLIIHLWPKGAQIKVMFSLYFIISSSMLGVIHHLPVAMRRK